MGKQDINDIERFLKKSSMTLNRSLKRKLCSDDEAEAGADRLIAKLNAPECRSFFLKVMYHLPYDERERILESSLKGYIKSSKKYFTHSARQAMEKLGY